MTEQRTIEPGSRLNLYSDGAFEITGEHDGQMLNIEGLTRMLAARPALDEALHALRAYQGLDQFTDDLSLVQVDFE
jgi:serine phosphatase RsbU (regulator of sigma subunit)